MEDNVWKLYLNIIICLFLSKNICFKLKERKILENS